MQRFNEPVDLIGQFAYLRGTPLQLFSFMNDPVTVKLQPSGEEAEINGKKRQFKLISMDDARIVIETGNRFIMFLYRNNEANITVSYHGSNYIFNIDMQDSDNREQGVLKGKMARFIKAPMPGSVLKVNVEEKDSVTEGQVLAILEAMKMETALSAPCDAVIRRIHAGPGSQVKAGECIIELDLLQED